MIDDLNPVQKKLLEMFTWLVDYLNSNNYTYYILAGTFLGACRHQGFIPWDDDIDIGMPRKEYERLIDSFSSKKEHYVLENFKSGSSDYLLLFSKIYDINTSMTMMSKKPLKRGLFIDIFPLDGMAKYDKEAKKVFRKISRMKKTISRRMTLLKKEYGLKNLVYILYRLLPINDKKMVKKINDLCSKYSFEESDYVGNLVGPYFEKDVMEKSIYGKPSIYSFEGLQVLGPEKYEDYLTHLYGNWREMPPVSKRRSHNNTDIDLLTPFSDKDSPCDIFNNGKH